MPLTVNPIQTRGGLKYPQRQKCLKNSENRKKLKKQNYKRVKRGVRNNNKLSLFAFIKNRLKKRDL